MQPDLDRAGCDSQRFGDLTVFQSLEFTQDKNHAVILRKPLDKALDTLVHFLTKYLRFHRWSLFPGPGTSILQLGLRTGRTTLKYPFVRGTSQPVEGGIGRDAINPGGELRLTSKIRQCLTDLDQDFLGQVFRIGFPDKPREIAKNFWLEGLIDVWEFKIVHCREDR